MLKWQLFQVLQQAQRMRFYQCNFKTETDKIRAVFYWTASNISYDVPGMFDLNVNETVPEKIAKTLKKRKGVCAHYAVVLMILLKSWKFSLIL
jgi:hypothetical protein